MGDYYFFFSFLIGSLMPCLPMFYVGNIINLVFLVKRDLSFDYFLIFMLLLLWKDRYINEERRSRSEQKVWWNWNLAPMRQFIICNFDLNYIHKFYLILSFRDIFGKKVIEFRLSFLIFILLVLSKDRSIDEERWSRSK